MPENILVVEYEPRYTDRVRQALAGQPFTAFFAKDGEEAMRSLDDSSPRLIVLSSVIPKISTAELIRAIRGRKPLQDTPILLTVSGYNGKSPKQDAVRMGASDILPKPYSEGEFLGKVQQMLGVRSESVSAPHWPQAELDGTVRDAGQQLTSNEIFGDLVDDERTVAAGARKPMSKQKDDLDKMLADTLSGMRAPKVKDTAQTVAGNVPVPPTPAPAPPAPPPPAPKPVTPPPAAAPPQPQPQAAKPPAAETKPRQQSGVHDLDKMLHDTLSGLEKSSRKPTMPANTPVPQTPTAPPAAAPKPAPAPAPPPAAAAPKPAAPPSPAPAPATAQRFNTARIPAYVADKVPAAQPVFPQAAPAPAPVPAKVEEEEPADGIKFGQYLLVEKIATGGMAEVWKARMRGVEGFQKIVAIKKILPHLSDNQDFIEMFVDEAKLAAQLNHNNIIHIYDLGKIQSSYYIAMEYIDGYDLKTILRRGQERDQPMQVELALFVASKIAAALDYAHRKRDFEDKDMGLVHRDVSPQNVLISQEGDIKLCDFGIAKAASKASHTQAGALKGKLQYMSPEQAWGRNIDKRSDIFALATVLFEMLTGRKLFTGDNELSILEQVREARVTAPSTMNDEVTPEIDAIVQKALQKDPTNRYQTAGEMARDIDAILYSFKPTPTSADLAIYMHRIYSAEPLAFPEPEPEPFPEVKPAPVAVVPPPAPVVAPAAIAVPSFHHEEPAPAKKSPMGLIAVAAVVLIAAGVGGWFALGRKGDQPATTTAPAPAPAAAGTVAPMGTTGTVATTTTAATTAVDPSLVDQEVAKRVAAERARLEQQARAQQQAATATAAPTRPAPAPVVPAPAPAPQQPPPQVAETRPAPAPVVEQPAPAPVQPAPQPVAPAPAPAAARAREGDLIPAGTEGLVSARVVKRGSVPYPPLAKVQRVEGTVVVSVLVSETGQVLNTRVIRGINRPVGLNEAAEQAMRRSTFAPGTKDGVRVKTWITVPVEFKL